MVRYRKGNEKEEKGGGRGWRTLKIRRKGFMEIGESSRKDNAYR